MEIFKLQAFMKDNKIVKLYKGLNTVKEQYEKMRNEFTESKIDCDIQVYSTYFDKGELVYDAFPIIHFRNIPEIGYSHEDVNY